MYIYGKNVVKETLKENKKIIKAYISKKSKEEELIKELKEKKIKINFVDSHIMDRMIEGNHQGFILEIDDVEAYSIDILWEDPTNNLVVILDHLEDPHNFGAIIRTSEALGVNAIIIPNDRSVGINGTVVKTSAGAINHIKIIRIPNLNVAITKLKEHNYWIVGTDMEGENYREVNYDRKVALIIGNEGHGMSKTIKENCDYIVKIPMIGKINSLNASVSCGIVLSEIVGKRQEL